MCATMRTGEIAGVEVGVGFCGVDAVVAERLA